MFLDQGSNLFPCIDRQILYHWATTETLIKRMNVTFQLPSSLHVPTHPHLPLNTYKGQNEGEINTSPGWEMKVKGNWQSHISQTLNWGTIKRIWTISQKWAITRTDETDESSQSATSANRRPGSVTEYIPTTEKAGREPSEPLMGHQSSRMNSDNTDSVQKERTGLKRKSVSK